ncbi:MAG: hypothetical protein ACJ77N_15690, partial [Chloroflexota bacterium]
PATDSPGGVSKPTAQIVFPSGPGGSIDINVLSGSLFSGTNLNGTTFTNSHYIDVVYTPPGGVMLDYHSILDTQNEFTATGLTMDGTPVPIQTLTLDSGPVLVPLQLETINGVRAVTRYGPSRMTVATIGVTAGYTTALSDEQLLNLARATAGPHYDLRIETVSAPDPADNTKTITQRVITQLGKETVVSMTELPAGSTDEQLLVAAIGKTGATRFRYLVSGWTPALGKIDVTFTGGTFKNADAVTNGGTVIGASNDALPVQSFTVEGLTAHLVDPTANGSIDVNVINDRNWIDVDFTAPSTPVGIAVDDASIMDLAPEFTLTGAGLGTVTLDNTRAPVLLGTPAGKTKTYRYWLTGNFAASGTVTLTYLAGTWSFDLATLPSITGITLNRTLPHPGVDDQPADPHDDGALTVRVTLPGAGTGIYTGFTLDLASITDLGALFVDKNLSEPGIQLASSNDWIVTLDTTRAAVRVGTSGYVFDIPVIQTVKAPATAASVTLDLRFATDAVSFSGAVTGAGVTQGGDSRALTAGEKSNTHTFIDVQFNATLGHDLGPATILDTASEFTISGFGVQTTPTAFSWTFGGTIFNAMNLGGGVFRFLFDGDFRPGQVDVNFTANSWDEQDARGPPSTGFNNAFTRSFTIVGATADLTRTVPGQNGAGDTQVALGGS